METTRAAASRKANLRSSSSTTSPGRDPASASSNMDGTTQYGASETSGCRGSAARHRGSANLMVV